MSLPFISTPSRFMYFEVELERQENEKSNSLGDDKFYFVSSLNYLLLFCSLFAAHIRGFYGHFAVYLSKGKQELNLLKKFCFALIIHMSIAQYLVM